MRKREIEIVVYSEERKVYREVGMVIILGKLEKARMSIILGRREYYINDLNQINIIYNYFLFYNKHNI